jgi:CRP-like cAMP-binding protein
VSDTDIPEAPEIPFLQKISNLRESSEFDNVTAFSKDLFSSNTLSPRKKETKKEPSPVRGTDKILKSIRSRTAQTKESTNLFDQTSLNQLSIRDWKVLCTGATRIIKKKGDIIISESQHNNFLYRIKSGVVRIEKKTNQGKVILGYLEKNQVFGEMSFVGDYSDNGEFIREGNVSASVLVQSEEAEFYKIERAFIFSLFLADKDLFARFYKIIALMLAERVVNLPFRKEMDKIGKKEVQQQQQRSPPLRREAEAVTLV